LGSLLSPLLRRRLSMRAILLIELYTWLGSGLLLIRPNVYLLTVGILPQAIAMPVTDSVVVGYRLAVTPDRLVGRVESARTSSASDGEDVSEKSAYWFTIRSSNEGASTNAAKGSSPSRSSSRTPGAARASISVVKTTFAPSASSCSRSSRGASSCSAT